mmetsp:Transcript_3315/g.10087  ORF Transcript_3315/g.10087 Transcript_3315/m.10087 type:complete len:118 (+) Transcript_3315:164-517(+)
MRLLAPSRQPPVVTSSWEIWEPEGGSSPRAPKNKKEIALSESTRVQQARATHQRFTAEPRAREADSLRRRRSFRVRRASCLQSQMCSLAPRVRYHSTLRIHMGNAPRYPSCCICRCM